MPRYFFNIHDGSNIMDENGTEFPNILMVRRAAIQFAGTQIAKHYRELPTSENWHTNVADNAGLVLFRLGFVITESAAAKIALRELT